MWVDACPAPVFSPLGAVMLCQPWGQELIPIWYTAAVKTV